MMYYHQRVLRQFFYYCVLAYFIDVYQIVAATNNTTATTKADSSMCSNHCAQDDADNSCWMKTQQYYDDHLMSTLNDWVAVQANIDQWNKRHGSDNTGVANETVLTTNRLSKYLHSHSVLDSEHLSAVISSLLNLTYTKSPSIITVGIVEFVCPTPCGYDSKLWMYLFIASTLVNIAMLLVVVPFIVKSERRDKKLYAKQLTMVQMLRPGSKSRNPSSS